MKAKVCDRKFNRCQDLTAHLDLANARRQGEEQRCVNVTFQRG